MASNHISYFSYNLSRPYPFRWFTPVAILGGIVLTTLFSVLNFAANGYVLGSRFVADPNSTLAEKAWFEKAPFSYQSKLSASCQSANIAPGTELTAKSGFQYQLGNVWTEDETGALTLLPSLTYLNNSFTDCTFRGIQIFLFNYDPQSNSPFWNWNRDSSASAYVTCSIDNGQLPTYLNLSITINSNLQSSYADDANGYLTAQKQTQASLWFGQLLMWMNFYQTFFQMAEIDVTFLGLVTGSGMYITRNPRQQDILEDDFMQVSDGYGAHYDVAGGDLFYFQTPPITELQIGGTIIGQAVDYFTKSFYSFVMADLGQTSSPNVLISPEILSKFWTACASAVSHGSVTFAPAGSLPASTFETLKQTTGPIIISNATLNAEYLCQIPRRKDTASIVVAVLVADLVLLQAAWKVFNWIAAFWVEKKNSEAKFCAGCAKYLASSTATNDGTDGPAGSYEMFKGSVAGSGATRYAKLPSVHVGDMDYDNIRRTRE